MVSMLKALRAIIMKIVEATWSQSWPVVEARRSSRLDLMSMSMRFIHSLQVALQE